MLGSIHLVGENGPEGSGEQEELYLAGDGESTAESALSSSFI
jgi:hypothetical protein